MPPRLEAGGLWAGVLEAEAIPLMSMVGEEREERGVSMVGGMKPASTGGDLDLPLLVETSSVAEEKTRKLKVRGHEHAIKFLPE